MSLIFSEGGVGGVTEEELQAAVNELQGQIDTISAASDCADIVGTYTDLQNYDTSTLSDNAIIKVLNDSIHDGAPSYYRWSTSTEQFTYIGSESRVNNGTLTIKQGSTTLGTFGANQGTNEEIVVADADLSNYYNKTQTDALLDEKQDVLTPNDPLTIRTYTKSNLVGFSYNNDNTAIYSTNGVGYNVYSTWEEVIEPEVNGSMSSNAWNNPSEGYNADSWRSYVDIPYQLGQTVLIPIATNCMYGKLIDGGKFIPIMSANLSSNYVTIYTSDNPYFDSSYRLRSANRISVATSSGRGTTDSMVLGGNPDACISQLIESGGGIMFTSRTGSIGNNRDYLSSGIITDSQGVARLKEVNVVRVMANNSYGYNASKTFSVDKFGLYNVAGDLYTLLSDVTNITSQQNLFDLSGVQSYNYLDLHIGAGLAVQDGNLVNTNPTAPTVMTGATSSTAGTAGLAPAPAAGDDTKFLSGDGTYKVATADLSNYYNKTQTDALLETKIPTDSVTTPLEYSIISHAQVSVENNSTVFWSKNPTWGISSPYSSAYRNAYTTMFTTGDGNGIIDNNFPVIYNGTVANREFRWTADNTSSQTYYPLERSYIVIGNLDSDGKFTPYYYVASNGGYSGDPHQFYAINPSTVTYESYSYGGHLPAHHATLFRYANTTSLFEYLPRNNTNLWAGKLKIEDNNGSPSFTFYGYDKSGNQVHTAGSSSNPYNVNIEDINCIAFNIYFYQASSTDHNYDLDKWGAYDLQGNKLWSVADTTYTKYLQLNIGAGLAVQGGNLVNTNPSLPTASTSTLGGVKIDGTSIAINNNGAISSANYMAGDGIVITDMSTSTLENNMTSSSQNVNASSYESGYNPYRAFDGDNSTYWGPSSTPSSNNPCWIERTHDPIKVTRVDMTFRENSEILVSGTILGSNDGSNYTEIGSWNNNSSLTLSVECEPSTTYTYTRIRSEQTNGGWGKVGEIIITYQDHSTPTTLIKEISADLSTIVSSTTIRTIVSCTQSEYDALVSGGTVDANTFYVIIPASNS